MKPRTRSAVVAILTFSALCGVAHADGLDSGYFVRFDSDDHSWTYFWTVLVIIMLANYILNFIVIGLPAVLLVSSRIKTVSVGLIVLTVFGQVADRLGAFAAIFVAMPFMALFSLFIRSPVPGLDNPAFGYGLFAANLFCSGIAVGLLAWWFLRKRWSVPRSSSWKIALAAAVLTNPAWILLVPRTWFQ
jgi:hypothetical protein